MDENTVGSVHILTATLGEEETALLRKVPEICSIPVVEALLAGLVQALTQWTGGRWATIDVMDAGRSSIPGVDDLDLSRTVGYLALSGRLVLEHRQTDDPGETLRAISEQARRTPNRGFGYGLLYWLNEEAAEKLPHPLIPLETLFNYVGTQEKRTDDEAGILRPAPESTGLRSNPRQSRPMHLYCQASIAESRLVSSWWYSTNLFKRATIERLTDYFVQTLQELAAHCQSLLPDQDAPLSSPPGKEAWKRSRNS
jgi:non-ribosomal peptide synthase protein (TIGR01720 family)